MSEQTAWLKSFPELQGIDDKAWLTAMQKAQTVTVPQGAVLFRDGDACSNYVLVVDGAIRVQKIDVQGHEIVLYRVEDGQTCMLTTSCLLGGQAYPAEGIAESEVSLVLLPMDAFDNALSQSTAFRRFVMAQIGRRIGDLMALVEDVAFGRMDERLARLITRRALKTGTEISCTHQELAFELGTAREVVSRLLKDFEHNGWLKLQRGKVLITSLEELQELAARQE